MPKFRPQVTYMTHDSLREYWNASSYAKPKPSKYITKQYETYRELKKDLKEICKQNIDLDGVSVIRSRRGEWGEWFEYWKLNQNGKPEIIKEGWN